MFRWRGCCFVNDDLQLSYKFVLKGWQLVEIRKTELQQRDDDDDGGGDENRDDDLDERKKDEEDKICSR